MMMIHDVASLASETGTNQVVEKAKELVGKVPAMVVEFR